MKRDWLVLKCTVLVAVGAFLVSVMGRVHAMVDGWAKQAMAEMDKEAP